MILVTLRRIGFGFLALLLAAGIAAASTSAFDGTAKDTKGQPIKNAEVRVTAKDGKIVCKLKTDANGHYISNALVPGTYKVDLFINSTLKATLAQARTKPAGSTELNFDLR